ncbi:MAG: hypothetical protein U1E05_24235 [Patescibacteria group bacterium]|nr:hypothetical protein [Patescibacteria group bacterium]
MRAAGKREAGSGKLEDGRRKTEDGSGKTAWSRNYEPLGAS